MYQRSPSLPIPKVSRTTPLPAGTPIFTTTKASVLAFASLRARPPSRVIRRLLTQSSTHPVKAGCDSPTRSATKPTRHSLPPQFLRRATKSPFLSALMPSAAPVPTALLFSSTMRVLLFLPALSVARSAMRRATGQSMGWEVPTSASPSTFSAIFPTRPRDAPAASGSPLTPSSFAVRDQDRPGMNISPEPPAATARSAVTTPILALRTRSKPATGWCPRSPTIWLSPAPPRAPTRPRSIATSR